MCFGHSLGCLRVCPAGAGYVRTGTEIVMFCHAVGTKVDLMYLAMNHRQVTMANITATPDPSRRLLRFSEDCCTLWRSHRPGFEINSSGRDQRA